MANGEPVQFHLLGLVSSETALPSLRKFGRLTETMCVVGSDIASQVSSGRPPRKKSLCKSPDRVLIGRND